MQVLEIWRYPVKSMLGEQLDQVEVGSLGVFGDRQRAVVDAESGVSLSKSQLVSQTDRRFPLILLRLRTNCRIY